MSILLSRKFYVQLLLKNKTQVIIKDLISGVIPLSRQLNFMQFEKKTIFYNKKNFYVKKLGDLI